MEQTYQATTTQVDPGFEQLKEQLLNRRSQKNESAQNEPKKAPEVEVSKEPVSSAKKYVFKKGDQSFELDDDYELEFMADKQPAKLTLRELKDRAAGDIAIKNRMHSLAEEKKQVQQTFKQFAELSKKDPLAALEFISSKASESDSEFEYKAYIEKLAEQAEKLGQMDEKERRAWELEKKLSKAEQDLSHKERVESVALRKQEMLAHYPEIGDSQFGDMVDAVLSNEDLFEGDEDEQEIMDKVEELIQETLTQRDIVSVIREINPEHIHDNQLIFSLSDQLRQNPDFDEEDVRDIVRDLIGTKAPVESSTQREKDIRTLSQKAREAAPMAAIRTQGASNFDLLSQKLLDRKKQSQKNNPYKR